MKKYLFILSFSFVTIDLFSQITLQRDLVSYTNPQGSTSSVSGDATTIFSSKENIEGSRYLFNKGVSGIVFITDSTTLNTEGFVFNYDKMRKKLIAIKDGKTIMDVNSDHIKSFVLITGNETDSFEKVSAINKEFFIKLVTGKKYSLYKTIQTKFQKADYFNNGIIERGNNYDSYVDTYTYFVVFGDGKYKKVELKRRSLKNTFSSEENKIKKYYKKGVEEVGGFLPVTEEYLKGLTNFLNQ